MGLREERKKQLLSLEGLAFVAEVDQGTISRLERGLTKPRKKTVIKLARGLGKSVTTMRAILDEDQKRQPTSGTRRPSGPTPPRPTTSSATRGVPFAHEPTGDAGSEPSRS